MSNRNSKSDNYIKQGSILAGASLLVRIIGMLYRFPMSNVIGEEGNGIYSVAFELYDVVLIISSYSLPLAISKLVSAKRIKKEHKNILRIFRCAMAFAVVMGGLGAFTLFFGASFFENNMAGGRYTGLSLPLRVLAPTILVVAIMGVLRGLYQDKGTMIPTAISQVIEQIVNAAVSIYAAYSLMRAHNLSVNLAGWGAAGGTMGTLFGAVSGLVILMLIYFMYRPTLIRLSRRDRTGQCDPYGNILKLLVLTALPIILSQTVYQISGIIDYSLLGSIQASKGWDDIAVKNSTGLYSTKYRLLLSVPIAIATAMSSSILPSVASSFTVKDIDNVKSKIALGIKFNMLIAFPCFMGLTILGKPILMLLFPSQDYVTGGWLLTAGSFAIVFYAITNISGACLQGIDKMRLPVIHSAIALVIHIIVVLLLLLFTPAGVFALVIGNIIFPLVAAVLNMYSICRYTGYTQEIRRTFLVPLAASALMGITSGSFYYTVYHFWSHNTVLILASVVIAVITYFVSYLKLNGATKEEIFEFPMGVRIVRLAEKLKIM